MSAEHGDAGGARSAFIPALLLALAVVGWAAFQGSQLLVERDNLRNVISEQEPQMEQSKKVRERLESLATRTARLAQAGNANATIIVEQLRKRGITIDAAGGAAAGPAAAQP